MVNNEELELEKIKRHLEPLFQIILERGRIIPTVASLAATVLVVASFNEKLLPMNDFLKVFISILLIIIPFSLFAHAMQLKEGERSIAKHFSEQMKSLPKKHDGKSYGRVVFIFISELFPQLFFL